MWISGGKPTQYADRAVEREQEGEKKRSVRAEDGDASKTVRKGNRCRAQNNTQNDSKLRDECCAENLWRSKSGGYKGMRLNQPLGGKGQVEEG